MSDALRGLVAVAWLDLAEVRRSRWLVFCLGVYALLAAGFVLVGLRESAIFGFTGAGRVLTSFTHALLLLLPLLALAATGLVINRARDDGSLELLFSHPISRWSYIAAITLVRYAALLVPLALLMTGIGLYARIAYGQALPWPFIARALGISAALLWAFCGFGLLVSTVVRNPTKAMMYTLLLWVLGVALLDFALAGMMLQWRANPRVVFVLATLNPVQAARMALLSSADPELSVLGPVGFYLANRIGSGSLYALGLLWPIALGTLSWAAAVWRFCRRDVV